MKEVDPTKDKDKVLKGNPEIRTEEIKTFDEICQSENTEGLKTFNDIAEQKEHSEIETFDDIIENPENTAKRKIAEAADKGLHQAYDRYLDTEKQGLNIAERTHLQNAQEFKEELRSKFPEYKEKINYVFAYCDGKTIYVNSDASEGHIYQVISHEETHLLSSSEFRRRYGEGLNEGVTEYLSRKANSPIEFKEQEFVWDRDTGRLVEIRDTTPHFYEEEVEIAGMIDIHARSAGEGTLERAYFRGQEADIKSLAEAVERSTGQKDALDHISKHLEEARKHRERAVEFFNSGQENEAKRHMELAKQEYDKCFNVLGQQKRFSWEG